MPEENMTPSGEKVDAGISEQEHNDLKSDFARLQTLNESLVAESNGFKTQLATFQESNEAMKAELESLKTTQKNTGVSKDIQKAVTAREEELRGELGATIDEAHSKVSQLEQQLKEYQIVDKHMGEILPKLVDNSMMHELIKDQIRKRFVQDKNNPSQILVLDDNGKPLKSPRNPAFTMTPEEYFQKLEVDLAPAFKPKGVTQGSMPSGQIAGGSSGSGQTQITREQYLKNRDSYDRSERVKLDAHFKL